MKKIAFASSCPSYWWAGCEYLWSQAALRLAKEGYDVAVHVIDSYPELPKPLAELKAAGAKIRFKSIKAPSFSERVLRQFNKIPEDIKWLNDVKADLVVINEGEHFEAWRWLQSCRERGLRYASITHGCTPGDWPVNSWEYDTSRKNYMGAAACFFVSNENLENIEMQIAEKLENARIVRNPFNVSYDAKPAWPSSAKKFKLACIGTAEPSRKGQDLLFRIMMQDKWRSRPVEVSLFCYGGYLHMILKDLKENFRLDNINIHEEPVTDVESVWAQHHALILPSRREGLPIVLVEAMLCARTAIVTDVGGSAEVLKDNVAGFVAAAATKSSLDEAMERAWRRRDEWEGMGLLAAKKIRESIPSDPVGVFVQDLKSLM